MTSPPPHTPPPAPQPTDASANAVATPRRARLLAALATALLAMVIVTAATLPALAWNQAAAPELRIQVNAADAPTLELIAGIGPALARRLIEQRQHRAFTDANDLQRVHGIGPILAGRIAPYLVFEPQQQPPQPPP